MDKEKGKVGERITILVRLYLDISALRLLVTEGDYPQNLLAQNLLRSGFKGLSKKDNPPAGYEEKIPAGRPVWLVNEAIEALEESIHFMRLSGEQALDFRTLNDFRGRRPRKPGPVATAKSRSVSN